MTKRKYISDIITKDVIRTWKLGEKYLIKSGTGSGKSFFVKNTLYDYCFEKGFRILLISNRNILKKQNETDLGDEKRKNVTTVNYQYLESKVSRGEKTLEYFFNNFKIIVMDEIHAIHSDSNFNRFTDLLINTLKNPPKNKIILTLTATPDIILKYYDFPKENVYTIETNYNYINKLSFYTKEETPELILQNLPKDERAIYFGDALQAYELSQKFEDSAFVCAEGNRLSGKRDENTINEIIDKSYFSKQILCSTSVMDNGINILDSQVTTIIIDTINPIIFIQELGRKRVMNENDTIKLYVKNQHNGIINFNLFNIEKQLKSLFDFEAMNEQEFRNKYKKKNYADVIDNDFSINEAKTQNLIFLKDVYQKMMLDKDGYKIEICRLLKKDYLSLKNDASADLEFERIGINEILSNLAGVHLYAEDIEKFKVDFFNALFLPKKTDYSRRGIVSMNAILNEDHVPYYIDYGKDSFQTEGKRRGYWIINYTGNIQ
jgi:hypothetical protein